MADSGRCRPNSAGSHLTRASGESFSANKYFSGVPGLFDLSRGSGWFIDLEQIQKRDQTVVGRRRNHGFGWTGFGSATVGDPIAPPPNLVDLFNEIFGFRVELEMVEQFAEAPLFDRVFDFSTGFHQARMFQTTEFIGDLVFQPISNDGFKDREENKNREVIELGRYDPRIFSQILRFDLAPSRSTRFTQASS